MSESAQSPENAPSEPEPRYGVRVPGWQAPQPSPRADVEPQGWRGPDGPTGPVPRRPLGAPAKRPGQVRAASILLWIASGAYALLLGASLVVLATSADLDGLLDQTADQLGPEMQQYSDAVRALPADQLRSALYVLFGLIVVVAAVAVIAGLMTWRGSAGWRVTGTVCGGLMALYQLLSLVSGDPFAVGGMAVCIVVIALWWSRPASAWFARRPAAGTPGAQSPWGP